MNSVKSLEPAVDPSNRITFLLDWELTLKCNLDCDYCEVGLHGGHDNSLPHPQLEQCLSSIDFMYEYADKMMARRIPALQYVVLNVYGGEALNHPHIVEILTAARERHSKYTWPLTITTTTNAIVAPKKFEQIIDLVDEFTVSWHTNNTDRQKQQFRNNVLRIKDRGRSVKCVILMHPALFEDAQQQIQWCQENGIKHLPRQLDHRQEHSQFNYSSKQVIWFNQLYKTELTATDNTDLANTGRACCGGRKLCEDQQYRDKQSFVVNKFPGWYCSVDQFFLYVKQANGEVYTNKDCKVNYQAQVGPIGYLNNAQVMLDQIGSTPVIQCIKDRCYCGLCAPKAADAATYNTIMRKYEILNSNLL